MAGGDEYLCFLLKRKKEKENKENMFVCLLFRFMFCVLLYELMYVCMYVFDGGLS